MKDNETWLRIKSSYGFGVFIFVIVTIIFGLLGQALKEYNYMAMIFVNDAVIGSFITLLILHLFNYLDTGEQTPDLLVMIYLMIGCNAILHG